MKRCIAIGCCLLACRLLPAGQLELDGYGNVAGLVDEGARVDVRSVIRIACPGWQAHGESGGWSVRDIRHAAGTGHETWSGRIPVGDAGLCRYNVRQVVTGGTDRLEIGITAEQAIELEGVYLFFLLPVSRFADGTVGILRGDRVVTNAVLPRTVQGSPHFLAGQGDGLAWTDKAGTQTVRIRFEKPCWIMIQDERHWKGSDYAGFVAFHQGNLAAGQTVMTGLRVEGNARADTRPVQVQVNSLLPRGAFGGVGGNYVYALNSPVTAILATNLSVRWGRAGMPLDVWEPRNDDASPTNMQWDVLRAADAPGSMVRQSMERAKWLTEHRVPQMFSIWKLPSWMYVDPDRDPDAHRQRMASNRWPEVLESIGSYLLHARRQYGVEPEWLSFNEPDIGCFVEFSAGEHREAIRRMGEYLDSLGLKTRLVLGDVASPRTPLDYVRVAGDDREARKWVGALAFHSWNGAEPAVLEEWASLAEVYQLPLLVTEQGWDPGAYRTPWILHTFPYALQELRLYQTILQHARPQALLQWELTEDYSLMEAVGGGAFRSTPRLGYLRQFSWLAPINGMHLMVRSDHPEVLATAFMNRERPVPAFTVHLANLGGKRLATVLGIPHPVRQLQVWRTTRTEHAVTNAPLDVVKGGVKLELPAGSLVTLTTME